MSAVIYHYDDTLPVVDGSSVVGSCVVDNLVLSSCSVVVSSLVSSDVSSDVTAVDSLEVRSTTVVVNSVTAVVSADVAVSTAVVVSTCSKTTVTAIFSIFNCLLSCVDYIESELYNRDIC